MKSRYFNSLKELIPFLEALSGQGYFFRGQRDAIQWHVIPSIFRENRLDAYIKKIQVPSSNYSYPFNESVVKEWLNCKEILEFVSLILYKNKNKIRYFEQLPLKIQKLFELGTFLLKYNFYLGLYVSQNPNNHLFDKKTSSLCEVIPYQVWATKDKFIGYIQHTLPLLLDIILMDGNIHQKGSHDNVITSYNQTFPQHYDFPTAAVDVTTCYLVALHFATDGGDKIDSTCFSVYAYKQLDFSDDAPCFLYNDDELQFNIRAQAQKGSFLFFRSPCTHYLETGKFPSLDKLVNHCINNHLQHFADVIKINVPYTNYVLTPLRECLITNDISNKTLKPDIANMPVLI
ncbi:FRG domain-containing protein [Legionella drozanskii]|uniref:FRG domain protein n=1 Tax=Legionella drozanskii LLAP-1 TaxID=1212489 RepID=A0A0W0T0H8_9GAMM|nr:FRG domain-containing protein [Legionella drozanskii]KTC89119.1 FRG domain protein [Legionella drozanskii LLAP-1]